MENKGNRRYKKNILLISVILLLLVSVISTTYAFFANYASDESLVGVVATPGLEVTATRVMPTNTNNKPLIPQLEDALASAVSTTHKCVDGNSNVVCHIYKIDVTNSSDANLKVKGVLNFTFTDEVSNLKYKLMSSATTLDTNSTSRYAYDDMDNQLVKDVSLNVNTTKTYYVVIWLDETESEQYDTGATYNATVRFDSVELEGLTSTYGNYLTKFSDGDDTSYFHNADYIDKIKNVAFVDYIDTSNAVITWDMSVSQNGGIIAWLDNNETSGYYDLYIGSELVIYGTDMKSFFDGMTYVDSIDFGNLDTSSVTNMSWMFYQTGYNSTVFTLDLGEKFDTSNVIDMSYMFSYAGSGSNGSTVFTLDLGDKFDTSSVTNMSYMFFGLGTRNTVFTLDLGNKFDTSNVTDMGNMFAYTGKNSTVFTLDLGQKFDTSNVTYMGNMFAYTGENSPVFTLDLGDKFDTSKVTRMNSMFDYIGQNNPEFTLDLGDKFDTSKVTDMSRMFYAIGVYSSTVLTLDLTTFEFENVKSYTDMFNLYKNKTIYVKNESDKEWLVSKRFDGVTNDNVIVKS